MKTVKFFTLGCKVNQYETQSIRERFVRVGVRELEDSQPADIYVINTCTVTHRADSESFSLIHRAKRENPQAKVMVTGCLVEKDTVYLSRIKDVDFVISKKFFPEGISSFSGHTRAFLKIQDGCNNFCSYCKVPLARGTSRSRPLDEIVQEANKLVNNGFKEIVLCGICLGDYGKDLTPQLNLVNLIGALENIEELSRIRLSSIEAGDITDGLIQKLAQSKKLCPHLHIPIQSGDDEILKKMNRPFNRQEYLNLIKEIKSCIPHIAITTDVMVGFPGERESNFRNTVDLIEEILPLKVHIFPYSRRIGTPAHDFKDNLSQNEIKLRIIRLKEIALDCSLKYKSQFIHKNMNVLIEDHSKEDSCFWQGYTDNYIKVLVKSSLNLKNQFISVRLKKIIKDYILSG